MIPINAKQLFTRLITRRCEGQHKGDFGHILVAGGSITMPGSVILSAQAAMRAGAGKVSVWIAPEHTATLIGRQPEVMLHQDSEHPYGDMQAYDVVLVGPGLGQGAWGKNCFTQIMQYHTGIKVLDADALHLLHLLEQNHDMQHEQYDLTRTILTPHPGEAAKLLHTDTIWIQRNRIEAVQALWQKYQCAAVILKGKHTLITGRVTDHENNGYKNGYKNSAHESSNHDNDTIRVYQSDTDNPAMSTAGMGDFLAGILAALLAQGLKPMDAAQLAVYWHSHAAEKAQQQQQSISVLASDLLHHLHLPVS